MSPAPERSRRDFLRGKLRDTTRPPDESTPADSDPLVTDPTQEAYLLSVGRRAMACDFQVFFNAGTTDRGPQQALEALDLVDDLETQLTIYDEESELCSINRHAADGPVPVEPQLFSLLEQAVELYEQTDGAFDITAGPLSRIWGFARREGRLPTESEVANALRAVGSQQLRLDPEATTVEFLGPAVELNLGGIGKGYALDRCATALYGSGLNDFLIHGGKSSVLARGTATQLESSNETNPLAARKPWTVGLVHPLRPPKRLALVHLHDGALSTSGSGTQFFHHQGRRYGHILDPRSGQPAEGMHSVTILAPAAAEADALSTALYVMGKEAATGFLETRPEIAAILVCPGQRRDSIDVVTCNLAPHQWTLQTTH